MMNLDHPLILASNSPRRQQILAEAGISFEVQKMEVDESYPSDLPKNEIAEYLAVKKNKAYRVRFKDELILTADTTVIIDNRLLEKPAHDEEAKAMLSALSDRAHQVVTGVCISSPGKTESFSDTTEVYFRALTPEEIEFYIKNYKPFDKAGAYGIQEWIGAIGITKIEGSYLNVMGLPMHRVWEVLQLF